MLTLIGELEQALELLSLDHLSMDVLSSIVESLETTDMSYWKLVVVYKYANNG